MVAGDTTGPVGLGAPGLAGADCGIGAYAGRLGVYPSVVLAKFRALADGARIATERL